MNKAAVFLNPGSDDGVINPNLYGHFAEHLGHCIYEGLWVGEDSEIPNTNGIRNDVVQALRELDLPVLRWPGGCFADEYHWKDGVGPRSERKRIYNSHWGGVVETNQFGTHEFFELCRQLDCKPYVCGNLGSGSVHEMQEWVEYMTSPAESPMADWRRSHGQSEPWVLPYFGVGNENWGCGGHMSPEYYANEYLRYNTYVRTYGPHKIERCACGPNSADFRWTEILMEKARDHMDMLSWHCYTTLDMTWPPSGSSTEYGSREWDSFMAGAVAMERTLEAHIRIMDKHDPEQKVGLAFDEWGTWHPSDPGTKPGFLRQQNTIRDAVVAAIHLNFFHRHCKRLKMANIAQTVNVLQAMVLTDGAKMLKTPTYWVFEMFKRHMGATHVPLSVGCHECCSGVPAVSASASRGADGGLFVTLACLDSSSGCLVTLDGVSQVSGARVLTAQAMTDHNTFDCPNLVSPNVFDAWKAAGGGLELEIPAMSVVCFSAS